MYKEVSVEVKSFIRAILLSSPKGVKQTQFHREYETYAKCKIDWRKMGFNDLYEFLLAIPDVARLEYSKKDAQNLIFGVNKKDIYASSHAKKAGMKGIGEKPRHPSQWDKKPATTSPNKTKDKQVKKRTVDVSKDATSVKVTVDNVNGEVLAPNEQGLYAVHIKDLPSMCTQEELEMIFKEYSSFRFCKIFPSNSRNHRFAFAKFSNQDDAVRAMREKERYKLRGSILKLSKATEQNVTSKQSTNENKTNSAQISKVSPPKNNGMTNSISTHDKKLSTSSDIISEIELMQLYSKYGMVKNIDVQPDRSVSLSFSSPEEALTTAKYMKEFSFNGCTLSLSNPQGSNVTVYIDDQKPGQAQNIRFPNKESPSSFSYPSSLDRSSTSSSSKENIPNSQNSFTLAPHTGGPGLPAQVSQGNYSHQDPRQIKGHLQLNQQQHQQQAQLHHQQQQQQRPPQQRQQQTQQLQHQQQQPQQPRHQQNHQQHTLSTTSSINVPIPLKSLEKDVHLILNKEDMERMCNAIGHPLEQKMKGLSDEIDILVTEVVDACRFWAIIDSKTGNWQQLEQLEEHLQNGSPKKSVVPKRFTLGAAKFTENNVWYRCFVLDVSFDRHAKVLYLDYGNVEWIPIERFSSLESIYLSLAPQANAFHLAGLSINYSSSDSLKEGAKYLKDLIGDKTLRAKRKLPASPNQAHILEVELFTKTTPSVCINDKMAATPFVCKTESIPKSPSSSLNAPNIAQTSPKNVKIKLKISWVQSASHIFYHKVGSENILKQISDLLNAIPSSERVFPKVGETVCYEVKDHSRKRVQILDLSSLAGAITTAKVRCIDYGNCIREAQTKTMLKLPSELSSIDPVAKEAYLDDAVNTRNATYFWPKDAYDVIVDHKDKVLDGVITNHIQNKEYIVLYNADGECLNKKIVAIAAAVDAGLPPPKHSVSPSVDTGITRRELGPAPLSASAVSIVPGYQGLPSLPSTHHNTAANTITQFSGNKSNSVNTNERQSHLQGSTSGFYMPPPPIDSQEVQVNSPRKPNNPPQGTQSNLPQGAQNNLMQAGQPNLLHGSQRNLPQGSKSTTISPQRIGNPQQASQNVNAAPQGAQTLIKPPQTPQNIVQQVGRPSPNPPQGFPRSNYVTQATFQSSWSPQTAQNLSNTPLVPQAVNSTNTATVSPDRKAPQPATLTSLSQGTVANHPNTKQPTQIFHSNVSSPKETEKHEIVQNDEWQKEREALLTKRREQEECIETLKKPVAQKQSSQNLQDLKEKLAKQVRIKELENQVLKLKKEIETLESEKANLQFHLLDN